MGFLNEEWLATSVGVAVTYVVFMQGMPVLIFQTLNVSPLRSIYNQRFRERWVNFLDSQLFWIVVLFILSNSKCSVWLSSLISEESVICIIFAIVIYILEYGFRFLIETMRSLEGVEKLLSKKIVNEAIDSVKNYQEIKKKDLEDLSLLARELPQGFVKGIFLEECERLVEEVLKLKVENPHKMISEVLREAVTLSVTNNGAEANADNMKKALEILHLAHIQALHKTDISKGNYSYLTAIVSDSIKEIGVCAIVRKDLSTVINAIEKLSQIDDSSRDMYTLGDSALQQGYIKAAVIASRKLGDRVRAVITTHKPGWIEDKRMSAWLGLVSLIHQKSGYAQHYAENQIEVVLEQPHVRQDEIRLTFKYSQKYFYRLADFSTADAILELQQKRYPELVK